MDNIDMLDQREAALLGALVKVRKPEGPLATGNCLWCEEPLANKTHRWCDKDCLIDFEKASKHAPHLIP